MRHHARAFAVVAALLWAQGAYAGSTINPNVPAQNSTLSSAVVRGNFAAAYNDVTNILGMYQGTTAPGSPVVGQDWLDTSATPATWKKRYNSGWGTIGTFNLSTGVFAVGGSVGCPSMPAFTGDITKPAASCVTTLATVNSNVGAFGSATQVGTFTVNAKGLVTAAANVTVTPAVGSITGLGTGVATALGVNVGTAGAFVVNGGALGTPSSGTLTNATGLPISTGLSGAGTGVLTALGINVGSAGAFVTFNGAGGTPSSMTATNLTGTAAGLTAGNVTTNANLTGPITSVGNATSIASQTGTGSTFVVATGPTVSALVVTGSFTATGLVANASLATMVTNTVKGNATSGTASPTDLAVGSCSTAASALIWTTNTGFGCNTSITAAALPVGGLTGTGTGVITALGVNIGSAGAFVTFNGAGGTPSSMTATNLSGTAAGLTAGNVTTNANLTGPITSVGNATSIASQTGTGTTFVMSAAPTITGHPTIEGVTATGATGTGNFVFSASPTFTGTLAAATGTFSGTLTSGANSGTGGKITFNGSTSGAQAIQVAAAAGALSALTLPTTNGSSGDVLSTNGSGVMSWISVGGTGTVTSVSAGTGMSFTTITGSGAVAVDVATAANFYAGTASKMVDAAIPYTTVPTPAFSATPTFDFGTAASFAPGVLTANITSMTCSNLKANQGGFIKLVQDGTGGRTSVFCTAFKWAGGVAPVLSTGPNAIDWLIYTCQSSTVCPASVMKNASWLYMPGVFRPRGMPANDNQLLRAVG